MKTINSSQVAQAIKDNADLYGWRIRVVEGSILVISRSFTPNDLKAFADCDATYMSVLGLAPRTRPGSDWGTDGSGVGALSAIKNGTFIMYRSGVSKRVLSALSKMKGVNSDR